LIDYFSDIVTDLQVKGVPEFWYGDLQETEVGLHLKNGVLTLQESKFPIIYMNTDYDENKDYESGEMETDLTIWFIDRSKVEYRAKDRHELELPTLRTLKESFITGLQGFGTWSASLTKELYFTKNQTEFESPVNIIKVTFRGLRYTYCLT
jgi:hypothetical protein